jgi:acyl-CoA thioesterase FadM
MNLFIRLAWLHVFARTRSRCSVLGPCRTSFRVAPTDLDVLRHVNNGVYLSLLDLARIDLMLRSDVLRRFRAQGWFAVVSAETISFRRSLRLLQRFEVETTIVGWDERAFVVQHHFLRASDTVATAAVRMRFLSRSGGAVGTCEVLALLDIPVESPRLPDWIERWSAAVDSPSAPLQAR